MSLSALETIGVIILVTIWGQRSNQYIICDPLHRNEECPPNLTFCEMCTPGYQVFNGLSNDTKIMFGSNSIPKLLNDKDDLPMRLL